MKTVARILFTISNYLKVSFLGCSNEPKEIKIDNQIWMAENLNVDHYRNGDPIPEVKDPEEWKKLTTGAWCYYINDPKMGKRYGKLYNWYAVNDPRGLAPEGWHIPSVAEFSTLMESVNKNSNALKKIGQGINDGQGTNTSGFSALLAGYRTSLGTFSLLGSLADFWSSTEYDDTGAYDLHLFDIDGDIYLSNNYRVLGFSVRCVKD